MSLTDSSTEEYIVPGDIVAVRHGIKGRQEGLVIGSHFDYAGRQIIEVQLDGELFHALLPTVTRVKRVQVVAYRDRHNAFSRPQARTIERRVYW